VGGRTFEGGVLAGHYGICILGSGISLSATIDCSYFLLLLLALVLLLNIIMSFITQVVVRFIKSLLKNV